MPGVKGKSGRKSQYQGLDIEDVMKKSIKTVRECLSDESIDKLKRAELGMKFIQKYLPDRVALLGEVNHTHQTKGIEGSIDGILGEIATLLTYKRDDNRDDVIDITPEGEGDEAEESVS